MAHKIIISVQTTNQLQSLQTDNDAGLEHTTQVAYDVDHSLTCEQAGKQAGRRAERLLRQMGYKHEEHE